MTVGFSTVTPVRLLDPAGASNDNLGTGKAAVSGDGQVIAAGAPYVDNMQSSSGAVVVWQRPPSGDFTTNVTTQKLIDPSGEASDYLGYGGVTLSNDGLVLAAASYQDDEQAFKAGSVLVWQRSSLSVNFSSPVKLVDPEGSSSENLGYHGLCLSANGLVLAVPVYKDDVNGASSGSVVVWVRPSTTTSFSAVTPMKLVDPNGKHSEQMGYGGVGLSADGHIIAVASPFYDGGATDTGKVIVAPLQEGTL
uniref:Uncharacterized protein n=1 Tax=Palpitomonas bilix TaxID=652834 RepID=A0A7S3DB39_9EUKA|mmetsp:Transcript_2949/g.5761  ORF Transcript_2949/g.5761 Transcript_2949/m.5761 type:complete len:250 (+) Transcript_2949:353-1102(+)